MHTPGLGLTAAVAASLLLATMPSATADERGRPSSPNAAPGEVPPAAKLAGGAVTLGQVASTSPHSCIPGGVTVAQYADGGPPGYVAPTAGVITSFSVYASGASGQVRLVIFGPSPTTNHRTVVAKDEPRAVVGTTVNTFLTRIPVSAGLSIGITNYESGMYCWGAGVAGDLVDANLFDPATSNDYSPGTATPNVRANVSAVLEPDADSDGFGDVSQDLCPRSKLTQAACPAPDTTVTKAPKKRSAKRTAKIAFSSTTPGSTFVCSVNARPTKLCTSPFRKKYRYGRHTVLVTAVSAFGVPDPTPATVRFKIKKPA